MTASSKWSSSILTTAATSTAETAALRSILRPRRSRPIQRPACRGSYIATIQGQGSATSYSPGCILILSPSWRPGALAGRAAGGACIELVPPKGPPIHKGPHWRGRRGDSVAVQHVHRRPVRDRESADGQPARHPLETSHRPGSPCHGRSAHSLHQASRPWKALRSHQDDRNPREVTTGLLGSATHRCSAAYPGWPSAEQPGRTPPSCHPTLRPGRAGPPQTASGTQATGRMTAQGALDRQHRQNALTAIE
jgi:hypothetical protein